MTLGISQQENLFIEDLNNSIFPQDENYSLKNANMTCSIDSFQMGNTKNNDLDKLLRGDSQPYFQSHLQSTRQFNDWEFVDHYHGIDVYQTSTTRQNRQMPVFKSIKKNIHINPTQFVNGLFNISNRVENLSNIQEAEVIERSSNSVTYYQRLQIKVGITIQRHNIYKLELKENKNGVITLHWQTIPMKNYPKIENEKDNNATETAYNEGWWILDTNKNDLTQITIIDPGKQIIPRSILNQLTAKALPNNMLEIINMVGATT